MIQLLTAPSAAGRTTLFRCLPRNVATPTVALRAGIGLNDNPVSSSDVMFNILAPGVQEQHYTAGLTWQVDPNNAINFGAMYSPSNSVTGQDPFGAHDITIEMYQWEATVGWTWTF